MAKEKVKCIIKGWVARDKDNSLWFHYQEPRIYNGLPWWGSDDREFELYDVDFPDLHFEDGPIKVELTIKQL